jgi:hypothetical protein
MWLMAKFINDTEQWRVKHRSQPATEKISTSLLFCHFSG